MALLSHRIKPIGDGSLDNWEHVGSGGFGHVYKARHKDWGFDVAVKILQSGFCSLMPKDRALSEEADHMERASCEFVLRVYGTYLGCPPLGRTPSALTEQKGIVMEFMGGGSLQSLLAHMAGPPPWPLAFRLAHQVALGMNFLHSRDLMHHDLKPSNVLLNDDLNAKIADFGLCRVSASALNSSRETTGQTGGSFKYMPPEAFEVSYQPTRAFDRYSFGILLWSIVTGKEPYPAADYSLVALRIPKGDRPPFQDITLMKGEGLEELVDLMTRCWGEKPSDRPSFKECLKVTENVLSKHKRGIHDAVHRVLTALNSSTSNRQSETSVLASHYTPECSKASDKVDHFRFVKSERSPIQNSISVSTRTFNETEKAKFVDDNRAVLIQDVTEVMVITEELGDMVHSETYSVIEAKATTQEKMRVLYQKALRSGGVTVKAAFYDALKKHHSILVDRLGG